jgi:hypothetical protein
MEDEAVGHQVVVFDGLPLLIPAVLRDDAFAAEESPFEEAVEGFALVCGTLDGRPELRVGDGVFGTTGRKVRVRATVLLSRLSLTANFLAYVQCMAARGGRAESFS